MRPSSAGSSGAVSAARRPSSSPRSCSEAASSKRSCVCRACMPETTSASPTKTAPRPTAPTICAAVLTSVAGLMMGTTTDSTVASAAHTTAAVRPSTKAARTIGNTARNTRLSPGVSTKARSRKIAEQQPEDPCTEVLGPCPRWTHARTIRCPLPRNTGIDPDLSQALPQRLVLRARRLRQRPLAQRLVGARAGAGGGQQRLRERLGVVGARSPPATTCARPPGRARPCAVPGART